MLQDRRVEPDEFAKATESPLFPQRGWTLMQSRPDRKISPGAAERLAIFDGGSGPANPEGSAHNRVTIHNQQHITLDGRQWRLVNDLAPHDRCRT